MDELMEIMGALNRGGMQPKRAYSAFVKCHGTQTIMPGISEENWKSAVAIAVIGGYNLYGARLDEFNKEIAA